jgi:hypothetical protein
MGNTERTGLASTKQSCRPCRGVEKEKKCGIAPTATDFSVNGKSLFEALASLEALKKSRLDL